MTRYWIGVASYEHVQIGVKGCFAQVCHGKIGTLKHMAMGDWLIYYSPTYTFGGKKPCRQFTAIGTIDEENPYIFKMNENFSPWRRNVTFLKSQETLIKPHLGSLDFIKDKNKWGFPFRKGSFEICQSDFEVIARKMEIF
jgi:hypothetical protein